MSSHPESNNVAGASRPRPCGRIRHGRASRDVRQNLTNWFRSAPQAKQGRGRHNPAAQAKTAGPVAPWSRSARRLLSARPESFCVSAQFPEHEADGGRMQERLGFAREALRIPCQATTTVEPSNGRLDDPAFGWDGEALGLIGPLDDLDRDGLTDAAQSRLEGWPLMAAVSMEFEEKRISPNRVAMSGTAPSGS